MIRWICSTKLSERRSMDELRRRLGLYNIAVVVQWRRLRWFGHLQRMSDDIWPKRIQDLQVDGRYPCGRPKKKWNDYIKHDLKHLQVNVNLTQDSDRRDQDKKT